MSTAMRHKGLGILLSLLAVILALPSGATASQSAGSHHFELVRTTDGPSSFRITFDVFAAQGASGVEAFAGAFALRTNEEGSIQRVAGLGGSPIGKENSPGIVINGSEISTCTAANVCAGSTVLGYQKFISHEDDGGPDVYNRLFIVIDGDVRVDLTFESVGWVLAETDLEYRYTDFRSSEGVGVVTPVRSADLFLGAELDGGELGSIAQAIPPCSSTFTGLVSRGIGELRLSGGEEPSSLRCPSVVGDQPALLDDVARGATTWSAEGIVAGDSTLQEGRLFVVDLPPCRFLIPSIPGEDLDSSCSAASLPRGGPPLDATDVEGDANGLNEFGMAQDTRPASVDGLDLVRVRADTLYESIPVGDDGVRREPTALRVVWTTLEPPEPVGRNTVYRLDFHTGGCRLGLEVVLVLGDPTQEGGTWHEIGEGCPNFGKWAGFRFSTDWPVTIDEDAKTVTVVYPFSTLTPDQITLLEAGRTLVAPRGESRTNSIVSGSGDDIDVDHSTLVDATDRTADWIVGSDVPPDIPCTSSCPHT